MNTRAQLNPNYSLSKLSVIQVKTKTKSLMQESLPLPLSVLLTRLKLLERPSLWIVATLRIQRAEHLQCIIVDEINFILQQVDFLILSIRTRP